MTVYETKELKAGRDKRGAQRYRNIDISTSVVEYHLARITAKVTIQEEDEDGWVNTRSAVVERRPALTITTKVVRCRNRFGIVKLYGPQGFTTPVAQILK